LEHIKGRNFSVKANTNFASKGIKKFYSKKDLFRLRQGVGEDLIGKFESLPIFKSQLEEVNDDEVVLIRTQSCTMITIVSHQRFLENIPKDEIEYTRRFLAQNKSTSKFVSLHEGAYPLWTYAYPKESLNLGA